MRILRVHNLYQQAGGEDTVFAAEVDLLRRFGHEVYELVVSNDEIVESGSFRKRIGLAANTIWSLRGQQLVSNAIASFEPDVTHFDNTFPLISPAAYCVAKNHHVAVVQTLHNYRLLCPSSTLYRDGEVCEDCLGKTPPFPGTVHACYRGSRTQTTVVGAMLTFHRLRRTWTREVDHYIALSSFASEKFVQGGLPAEMLSIKPNFVASDPGPRLSDNGAMLFVGRLSPEKGISTLLEAATSYQGEIRVAGSGPSNEDVRRAAAINHSIRVLGRLAPNQVAQEMLTARALVFPSTWYEGMPMTIIEAFSRGLPVIASRLGTMAEMIDDGQTGLLFEPGTARDLAAKLRWAQDNPDSMREMGQHARREYEAKYTPERNYGLLMDIYRQAIDQSRSSRP